MTADYTDVTPVLDYRAILTRSVNYAINTWWAKKGYPTGSNTVPTLANDEYGLRGAACVALTITTADTLNLWDTTQVNAPLARTYAARLISAIARQHVANSPGGWGGDWQTAFWASTCALSAMLGWYRLIPNEAERSNVARMVEYEANRLTAITPPVWTLWAGTVVTPGDSKAEENAWNSTVLATAAAMMPDHSNAATWTTVGIRYAVSAFSHLSDQNLTTVIGGSTVATWLAPTGGYNVTSSGGQDYIIVNHNIIHPDYQSTLYLNLLSTLAYTINNMPVSRAWTWNLARVWRAFQVVNFASGTYAAPGGTLFQRGADLPYYPQGNDWGARRPAGFLPTCAGAAGFGLDTDYWNAATTATPASYWERMFLRNAAFMQARATTATHPTGAMYENKIVPAEDTYAAREEWVMSMPATACLLRYYGPKTIWTA